jgi:poly-gamma-glutamate capsule biosynthesis protein CapA/YwtB (metallophosphatase superfamily)
MTGRGIDQVLPHPSNSVLYEPYVTSAVEYVAMAENAYGRIPKPVDFSYIWGDAIEEIDRMAPTARVVNLETSVTTSEDYVRKGINYRMHPANTTCLFCSQMDTDGRRYPLLAFAVRNRFRPIPRLDCGWIATGPGEW